MRVGLIARADNRGLGQQTWAFYRNMQPAKTMVVNCPSEQPLVNHFDRFPDATIINGYPGIDDITSFLDGLDAVYTAETSYNPALWQLARERGVHTVLHANFEFLDIQDRPTVWAAPSLWRIENWPHGTIHLPVPIETDRLTPNELPETATNFLHVIGRPTFDRSRDLNRNGTLQVLQSLRYIDANITVTIRCQQPGYVGALINDHSIRTPDNITLRIEPGDHPNYWDAYTNQHAMILPRRFGGLCLPANEAIGAGIPIIMSDIDPNNRWLPKEWLTPAHHDGEFVAKQHITCYTTDPAALAQKITQLATDASFFSRAAANSVALRDQLAWPTLKPRYNEVLTGCLP